jgi:DNA-binding NarL/FixJ family response regulator
LIASVMSKSAIAAKLTLSTSSVSSHVSSILSKFQMGSCAEAIVRRSLPASGRRTRHFDA